MYLRDKRESKRDNGGWKEVEKEDNNERKIPRQKSLFIQNNP